MELRPAQPRGLAVKIAKPSTNDQPMGELWATGRREAESDTGPARRRPADQPIDR
jgi:hypothetical protein